MTDSAASSSEDTRRCPRSCCGARLNRNAAEDEGMLTLV